MQPLPASFIPSPCIQHAALCGTRARDLSWAFYAQSFFLSFFFFFPNCSYCSNKKHYLFLYTFFSFFFLFLFFVFPPFSLFSIPRGSQVQVICQDNNSNREFLIRNTTRTNATTIKA